MGFKKHKVINNIRAKSDSPISSGMFFFRSAICGTEKLFGHDGWSISPGRIAWIRVWTIAWWNSVRNNLLQNHDLTWVDVLCEAMTCNNFFRLEMSTVKLLCGLEINAKHTHGFITWYVCNSDGKRCFIHHTGAQKFIYAYSFVISWKPAINSRH